jgi:hypothetical protein
VARSFRSDWWEAVVFSSHSPSRAQLSPHPFGVGPRFHDLCVGEALTHAPKEWENSGGGKFPSQISRRKDQAGSLGTEGKTFATFLENLLWVLDLNNRTNITRRNP